MKTVNIASAFGRLWCVGLVLLLASGCQTYTAQPLDFEQHVHDFEMRRVSDASLLEYAAALASATDDAFGEFDVSDGLSVHEAEIVALFFNAEIRMQRLVAGVARVESDHAGMWEDPTLSFDGTELLSPDGPFEFGVMLDLTIPISGRLATEKDSYRALAEVARLRLFDAEWRLRNSVRAAWIEWVVRQKELQLAEESLASVERVSDLVNRLEEAGEMSRVDARVVRVELASRRDSMIQARAAVRSQRQALLHLLGLPANHSVELQAAFPMMAHQPSDDARDVDVVLGSNTRVAIQRAEYEAAEAAVVHEIQKQYPDLNFGIGYGNEDDDRLLFGLSIPIPMVNANRGAIERARAERDVARARAEAVVQDEMYRMQALTARLADASERVTHYESDLLPLIAQQIEDIESLMSLGSVDSLLVLDAVDRDREAKQRMLALHAESLRIMNAINALRGPVGVDEMSEGAVE